jgi:uncharacterized membrane protein YeaQ/YmgE (transglycosylase-associated protein family)
MMFSESLAGSQCSDGMYLCGNRCQSMPCYMGEDYYYEAVVGAIVGVFAAGYLSSALSRVGCPTLNGTGWAATIGAGVVGAVLGGVMRRAIWGQAFPAAAWPFALLGAAVLLLLASFLFGKRLFGTRP